MPTGWDSILTVISFGDCFGDGLEMLLAIAKQMSRAYLLRLLVKNLILFYYSFEFPTKKE